MENAVNKKSARMRQRLKWFGIWFGAATIISLLRFSYRYLDDLARA
jgi:hypothetical protein